jgi:hypothetical protein
LGIHLQTFPFNPQPFEKSKSNQHPELICVRKPRFQAGCLQVIVNLRTGWRSGS